MPRAAAARRSNTSAAEDEPRHRPSRTPCASLPMSSVQSPLSRQSFASMAYSIASSAASVGDEAKANVPDAATATGCAAVCEGAAQLIAELLLRSLARTIPGIKALVPHDPTG